MLEIGVLLLCFFVVLEILWRVWKYYTTGRFPLLQVVDNARKVDIFQSHPYSLYSKRPHSRGAYPSNGLGYAGVREYDVARKDCSVRIMVVGGSTVEDHAPELGPESSWPAILEDLLNESFPSTTVEVINAGLSGYSSVESLVDFLLKGVDLKPDILIVYHNINDVLTIQMADGFRSDYSHVRQAKSWRLSWAHKIPQVRVSFVYEFLRFMLIKQYGLANTILDRISSPPWDSTEPFDSARVKVFKRNIFNLASLAHANGCTPVLLKWECPWETDGVYPWAHMMQGDQCQIGEKYFQYIRANNASLKEVASQLDFCGYLDVGPIKRELFQSDNLHFTGVGLREMAERVAQKIEPTVRNIIEQSVKS